MSHSQQQSVNEATHSAATIYAMSPPFDLSGQNILQSTGLPHLTSKGIQQAAPESSVHV